MSISVTDVSKFYGRQQALKSASFEVKSGEIVGFLGPNGAGKSTMMKILTGYLPASSGKVAVCGLDVTENSIELRRKIGYLPEHNPLYTDMYVTEYLRFVGGIYHLPDIKTRVEEMIEMTGLRPECHKKIRMLSKGYRQRVGLAQALLPDPEVLILDEPTTGFDPNQVADVRNLIRTLGKSKTILLSTHIMQEVQAICERVIIIHQGQIVADEKTAKLDTIHTAGDTIIEVEFDRQPAPEQLIAIQGIMRADYNGSSWVITSQPSSDVRGSIFRFAVENDLILLGMKQQKQSLEDVFQALTTK
ncbi:gliding motility-associated ABC transporter ATP-binding subunit GldA [Alkaliflexus imshenetskii]|uniref:gliding motility-associated ABC transporter ATP-binding subunit GldA n=1 Tax=Alkaliflexus imshenetskii TaxID=286730 RepID=UPI00047D2B79|nr:gliding motility-associated ABC transporter ATP-binding subunit GldA [Alkaliflexus imshenetskii]